MIRARWLTLPLAGLVLAALPWLLLHPRHSTLSGDGPPSFAAAAASPTLSLVQAPQPAPPELLPAHREGTIPFSLCENRDSPQVASRPPLGDPIRLALATGYAADPGNSPLREEAVGPMLIGPSSASWGGEIGGRQVPNGRREPPQEAPIDPQPPWDAAAPPLPQPPPLSVCPPPTAPGDGLHPVPPLEGSPLPTLDAPAARSEQLENIARQADQKVRHGFELAGRGASFAARSEFIAALRLVAQGLDAEAERAVHSRALAAGLTAMKEAEDFVPDGSRLEADLDVPGIIGSHRTPVLKGTDARELTPLLALKCYFTFAQEQLAAAAGHEVAGSMALHALGKLHATLARQRTVHLRAAEPKAMACYQAALLVCPQNFMAANDLGVLLAQHGHYADARRVLEHSLEICRQSTGWRNLAVVYQQLGQGALARRAYALAEAARRAEAARSGQPQPPAQQLVRWVDPATLAQASTEPPLGLPPADPKAAPQGPTSAAGKPAVAARPATPAPSPPGGPWPATGQAGKY